MRKTSLAQTRHCSSESRLDFSHPWEETELAASHRPSRDNAADGKEAGKQLHYGTVTAGSAEGEAPVPILMRLHAADKARARMRARNNQMLPESILAHGNPALPSCQLPWVWRHPDHLNWQQSSILEPQSNKSSRVSSLLSLFREMCLFYNSADDAKAEMFCQQYMITSLIRRQLKESFINRSTTIWQMLMSRLLCAASARVNSLSAVTKSEMTFWVKHFWPVSQQ